MNLESTQWLWSTGIIEQTAREAAITHAQAMASAPPSRGEIAMRLLGAMTSAPDTYPGPWTDLASAAVLGADALIAALAEPKESK